LILHDFRINLSFESQDEWEACRFGRIKHLLSKKASYWSLGLIAGLFNDLSLRAWSRRRTRLSCCEVFVVALCHRVNDGNDEVDDHHHHDLLKQPWQPARLLQDNILRCLYDKKQRAHLSLG